MITMLREAKFFRVLQPSRVSPRQKERSSFPLWTTPVVAKELPLAESLQELRSPSLWLLPPTTISMMPGTAKQDPSSRRNKLPWKRPADAKDECCICLEEYNPGETICLPITQECNHIFHHECIQEWILMNHDRCPLCRTDIMS